MEPGLLIVVLGVVIVVLIFVVAAAISPKTEHRSAQAATAAASHSNTTANPAAGWLADAPHPTDARGARLQAFGPFILHTKIIRYGDFEQPLHGITASVEASGAVTKRVTATRVIVGGVLFAGAGAIVGALAKKRTDSRELYVHIDGAEQYWVESFDPKKGAEARQFVAALLSASKSVETRPESIDSRFIDRLPQ